MKVKTKIVQAAVICVAILFIVLGIIRGEHNVVLSKAIRICLTCIGIG